MYSTRSKTNEEESKRMVFFGSYKDATRFAPFVSRNLSYLGMMEASKEVVNTCHGEFRCNICKERSVYLGRVVDSLGHTFCSLREGGPSERTPEQVEIGEETQAMKSRVRGNKSAGWTLELIPKKSCKINNEESGGHKHYHINYGVEVNDAKTEKEGMFYNKALRKYVPLVYSMLNNLSNEDWRTLSEQMPVVERVLGEESYGEKALGSVKWFNSIMRKVKEYSSGTERRVSYLRVEEQMEVVGEAILSWVKTPDEITEEERAELPEYLGALYDEPLLTVYHQFNKNVLDMMSSAYNEGALRSMVVSRFSPSNYQRKTAAPSASKLEMSAQILGDYSFTISTTEEIEKYPECVKVGGVVEGGGGAMSLMKSMKAEKSSKYAFGSKTGPAPKTLSELCSEIKSGKIRSVEISTDNMTGDVHTACYVAETTLSRSHRIAPYGWLFLNGQTARFSGVQKVTHIMAIRYGGKENYIFILSGSKGCRRVTSNIGWSEYLSSSVRQIAGSTFEEVARRMPVKYPEMRSSTELAIGIGTSRKDVDGELTKKIYVRINKTRWITIYKA